MLNLKLDKVVCFDGLGEAREAPAGHATRLRSMAVPVHCRLTKESELRFVALAPCQKQSRQDSSPTYVEDLKDPPLGGKVHSTQQVLEARIGTQAI